MALKKMKLPVKREEMITATSKILLFDLPPEWAGYKAGQYLTTILNINGKEERRAYSMFTSPHVDDEIGIAVKAIDGGLVSNFIKDTTFENTEIELLEPSGNFTINFHHNKRRRFVFIGAGGGITPLFSLIKSALLAEPKALITLIYANRSKEEVIFWKELNSLAAKNSKNFRCIHVLKNPPNEWEGPSGRLNPELLKELLYQTKPIQLIEETNYFLCGPSGFMKMVEDTLEIDLKVSKEHIKKESFLASLEEVEVSTDAVVEKTAERELANKNVKVILEGEEFEFVVGKKDTILRAGLDAGIDMPYSCQGGVCTACIGILKKGSITMDHNEALTDGEVEEGYMLCCQARPTSNDVIIEIE